MYFEVKKVVTGFNIGDYVHVDRFAGRDAVKRLIDLGVIEPAAGSPAMEFGPQGVAELEEECRQLTEALAAAQEKLDAVVKENAALLKDLSDEVALRLEALQKIDRIEPENVALRAELAAAAQAADRGNSEIVRLTEALAAVEKKKGK